jgi:hypothetical protein
MPSFREERFSAIPGVFNPALGKHVPPGTFVVTRKIAKVIDVRPNTGVGSLSTA